MFDARPVAARRRFPAWFLALGLLLGLNLLALLYVLLRDERSAATTAPVVAVPAATVPTASQPPLPAPPVAPAEARPARSGDDAAPAAAQTRVAAGPISAASTASAASAAASTAASAAASTAAPARTRDDLLAAGDAVPEIQVSLHVYDADPAKRFVFLEGQRLREGDVAANGLRVERIDADGVVLDHRGNDFKVPLEP